MFRIALLALTAALVMPLASATAATYVDIDDEGFLKRLGPGQSVSGTFDIVNPGSTCILSAALCDRGGFSPGSQQIDSGHVTFAFLDYGAIDFEIDLGSGAQTLAAPATFSFLSTLHIEVGALNENARDDLETDGLLAWSVTNTADGSTTLGCYFSHFCKQKRGEGFYLKAPILKAKASNPIPEPTGALLFAAGFGVVGVTLRRRQRARS